MGRILILNGAINQGQLITYLSMLTKVYDRVTTVFCDSGNLHIQQGLMK